MFDLLTTKDFDKKYVALTKGNQELQKKIQKYLSFYGLTHPILRLKLTKLVPEIMEKNGVVG